MDGKKLEELKQILTKDYNLSVPDDQVKKLGISLLRLTRIAVTALARADEKNSSIQAREETSLEPKTSA
jgi:hypothetical protein